MEKDNGYTAIARWLIGSPYKIRPVADLVRRLDYPEAIAVLENVPHKGARMIKKEIQSAAANALDRNNKLDEGMLYVSELLGDDGPRLKRVWFRARGRADMQLKRMCHIRATVAEKAKAGA